MTSVVEAQLPSNSTQSVPVAGMASMQIQSAAPSNPFGGLPHGCDPQEDHEIDEDEEEYCEPTEKIAPELLTEAMICSGYMLKRGEKRKTWKKRWVVLRASRLAFYKNHKEYRLTKVINTSEIRAVVPVEFKRVGITIGIVTPDYTLYLRDTSPQDTYRWIENIESARPRDSSSNYSATQPSGSLPARNPLRSLATRAETGPATPSPRYGSQGISPAVAITPRSRTAPPVSISQVCDDMHTQPNLLSASPTSIQPRRGNASELDEIPDDGRLTAPAAMPAVPSTAPAGAPSSAQQVISSSEEEYEADDSRQAVPLPKLNPAEDANRIIAQGYLMKQSFRRKQWRKRWFVLTKNQIFYARSHMDSRASRSIFTSMILDVMECEAPSAPSQPFHLRSISGTSPTNETSSTGFLADLSGTSMFSASKPRLDRCFKIVTPKRNYFVCAPTEEEEIKWISALQTIVNRQRSTPMPQLRAILATR
ncbi:hypothetical protein MYAM1_001324 [Malassezia yamatoensis]|uniref:PH domain-containing protein n=1 Tax=Malassezia yamatoensis TaxID=253288 RepID=A0AAJ6CGB4_9BASI|nr:hypothetical protein MYAM1_001324 [Malassezia yamatoensis]